MRSTWFFVAWLAGTGGLSGADSVAPVPAPPLAKWESPPPAKEPADVAALIDRASTFLRTHPGDVSAVLSDTAFDAVRPWPRFRDIVRTHASTGRVTMVTTDEPGTRIRVRIRAVNKDGSAAPAAMIYAYQTSARGGYAKGAAHFQADSGDVKHARLFAYVRTDAEGVAELSTIRPGGYPDSNLPQHIHVAITTADGKSLVGEVLFDDDPRLTPEMRASAPRENGVISQVEHDANGDALVDAEFRLN